MIRSCVRVFVVLCLLPALVLAQDAPAYAGQEDQTSQDQTHQDQNQDQTYSDQNQSSQDQNQDQSYSDQDQQQDQRDSNQDQGYDNQTGQDQASPDQDQPQNDQDRDRERDQTQDNRDQSYNDSASPHTAAPAVPQPVKHSPEGYPILEDGTPVRLRLTRTLSSADCQVGDRVDFQVVDPIVLDGVTVIPQDSIAWGKVIQAERKKRLARGGKLAVMIQSVRMANAERAPLRAVREAQGKGHTMLMGGAMIGAAVIFLPVAPVFLLMHGRDVKIREGTEITAYINGDTNFVSNPSVYGPAGPQSAPAAPRAATPAPASASAAMVPSTPPQASAPAPPQPAAEPAPMREPLAEAAPLSTELRFTSTPEGADVELDGNYIGRTPSVLGVPGGEHTVRMRKNGYQPYETKLQTDGGTQNVHAELHASAQ